jgi:ribose-phosphate pyrophosphokinase
MELVTKKRLLLFAGRGHPTLSEEIAHHLEVPLASVTLSTFANGEIYCRYDESIRGADVFVLQTHCDPINDRIFEQLNMIDAAKRASAKRITAVCPFYGYARQDRKAEGREPITARLLADMLSVAGADRVVTIDLHTGQIQGFFDFPVDHLTAVPLLAEYVSRSITGEEVTVVAPDAGGGKLVVFGVQAPGFRLEATHFSPIASWEKDRSTPSARVARGSFASLNTGPDIWLRFARSSSSMTRLVNAQTWRS